MFQNPFSDKKDENKVKENIPPPKETKEEVPEADKEGIQVEEGDGAIQHLIYYSFYPSTCMVPLGENFISIKENVPDLMKVKSNDALLQETIKTFHGLMQEKDDEILNLRLQLKNDDPSVIKMVSETIQTDLTLTACEEMERQLNVLSVGLPEKEERIHQLQLEKTRLQKSMQESPVDDPSKISQLEDELCESLKTLQELEESNLALSKEIKDLKQSNLELTWQLEEINDLKVEVELAKIQTEENMNKIKDTFHEKDKQIKNLKEQLKSGGQADAAMLSEQDVVIGASAIPSDEYERVRKEYDEHILELELRLKDAENRSKGNEEEITEVPKLIERLKEQIIVESSNSKITTSIIEMLPKYTEIFKNSDTDTIEELVTLGMASDTSEDEVKTVALILGAVDFGENGQIDESVFKNNCNNEKRKKKVSEKGKEGLKEDILNLGLMVKVKQSLYKMDVKEVQKEYMKLEVILNFLDRSYKPTPFASLNSLPKANLIIKIVEIKATIYDICMHTFWDSVAQEHSDEKRIYARFPLTSVDKTVFRGLIFPSFTDEQTFRDFLQLLVNVREILLSGEVSQVVIKSEDIQFMKMKGLSVYYDLCHHVLPIFPKEIRYVLMGRSIEEVTCSESKLLNYLSPDFLSILYESSEKSNLDVSVFLFDVLSILDFEEDIFTTSSKTSSSEFKVYKLSVSSVTNKTDSSMVKLPLNKSNKGMVLKKIEELQNVMKTFEWTFLPASYQTKPESELTRILIEKKENALKIIFKNTFHPVIEKISMSKSAIFYSSVSKEMVGLDYWIKNLLDKYRQKQLKQLNNLTVEDMEIYLARLHDALKLMSSFVSTDPDPKKSKGKLVTMIFKYRRMLKLYIDQYFLRKTTKSLPNGKINEDQSNEVQLDKSFQNLKDLFYNQETSKEILNDVLQRLYDIDYEIYPGQFEQDIEKKDFSSIPDGAIFEEILKLRLYIAVYVIAPYQRISANQNKPQDLISQFVVLKEIETILTDINSEAIDEKVIKTEYKLLKEIVVNLKKKKNIDDEKLKNCFLYLKKVECGINDEVFDSSKAKREYDRIDNREERKQVVFNKSDQILNMLNKKGTTCTESNKVREHYAQIEELLVDIEDVMPMSADNGKTIWKYSVRDKCNEIVKLISPKESSNHTEDSSVQQNIMNNLDYIKVWALEGSDWRREYFNRLNNLIRRMNSVSQNRKNQTSNFNNSDMTENFQDEKEAFEKAFSHLEDRLDNLVERNEKDGSNIDELDLDGKSDDELRSIILSLEKEISQGEWTKSDEDDAKSWLISRNREELIDDCNCLVNKCTMIKIQDILNRDTGNERTKGRPFRDNISQFEDDINAKLAKYEELCNTVEKLKVPQRQRRIVPGDHLQGLNTTGRRRNEMTTSYENQSNGQLNSHTSRMYSSQNYLPLNDDDIDDYFQQRMKELQKFIKFPHSSDEKERPMRSFTNSETNVLVDGFEIEDQKTPRYYSMKLQDIQHERKEDEMGAILHHMEKHKADLLAENENLQQQLYVSKSIQENQSLRLTTLEKAEDVLRKRLTALGSDPNSQMSDSYQEIEMLRHEKQNLATLITKIQKKMDQLNSEVVTLSSSNASLQHDNHNLVIKNQYLERSMNKLEEMYADLMQQLGSCQSNLGKSREDGRSEVNGPMQTHDVEKRLRVNEMEKIELVKKLDIIDQQNKLLRKHCEKMNTEISTLTRRLAEANSKSDTQVKQIERLVQQLDKTLGDDRKVEPSLSLKIKDDEIKNLKNKILHLETRVVSAEVSPSGDRLKQELIHNKEQEIMRLKNQIGSLQDRLDESVAQLEVKDYENQKLVTLTRKLQNKINDDSYFPPSGYKLVKDS